MTPALPWLAAVGLAIVSVPAASAQFNLKDGQILGRTIGYTGDGLSGIAVVGVVFVPSDPASRQEAEQIQAVVGDGLATGRVRLQVQLLPVTQLTGASGLSGLYLTSGLDSSMDAVFGAARRLRVPTISASLACVEQGHCVVGFTSEPTVQILLNEGAAERTGVHFLQAFRMLVREK